ncbi:MAG: ATP-binding protein [Dehalococcoidia bacterium]
MRKQVGEVSALPSKRIYYSIIADYELNRSICELIDNALDLWVLGGKSALLKINIDMNVQQQVIEVSDNAGGVSGQKLSLLLAPGETSNRPEDETIGIFGVGTKRAVVALAQEVTITTRHNSGNTCEVTFDDRWLETADWQLPYYEVDPINPGMTRIMLQRLRSPISKEDIDSLREHLSVTYAKFLKSGLVEIYLSPENIKPKEFTNWAYPPTFEPRCYKATIIMPKNRQVEFEAIAGLTTESSPVSGEYGIYIYCNDRLVGRAIKSIDVGFVKGLAGLPHPRVSIMRVIISLKGSADLMPWNSSKSDINPKHNTFLAFRDWLLQITKEYASLARRLEGIWNEVVFPFDNGSIVTQQIANIKTERHAFLPRLPVYKPRYLDRIAWKNQEVTTNKPWTLGISEAMIAVDLISKQKLKQKNGILLILLDSTLEIAFKEYLVNESGRYYGNPELYGLFNSYHKLIEEMKKYKPITDEFWKKVKYFHNLRSKLIHERSSAIIDDSELDNFKKLVESILGDLFNLKFDI